MCVNVLTCWRTSSLDQVVLQSNSEFRSIYLYLLSIPKSIYFPVGPPYLFTQMSAAVIIDKWMRISKAVSFFPKAFDYGFCMLFPFHFNAKEDHTQIGISQTKYLWKNNNNNNNTDSRNFPDRQQKENACGKGVARALIRSTAYRRSQSNIEAKKEASFLA